MVAEQCTSDARCPPCKQHLYLLPPNNYIYLYLLHTLIRHYKVSYYPVVPGEKVSAVMFCKQFLAYAVHIGWWYHSIHKQKQVGLNMHLYDNIGDASSSLRGSTSTAFYLQINPTQLN